MAHKIIHLISSPRNVSTALMYSFANRGDIKVVDEPFYAYYLNKWGVDHPGKSEIIASQPTNPNEVIQSIELLSLKQPIFLKDMAQHIFDLDLKFLKNQHIVLLIRNPKPQIFSFSKVIEKPTARDIGLKDQFDIYKWLVKNKIPFCIIDSNELLKQPKMILTKLCEKLNISFSQKMLTWKIGAIKEDGIWAKYWYKSIHESKGWMPFESKEVVLNNDLEILYQSVKPLYEALFSHAIK